jgi:hypothetical protein
VTGIQAERLFLLCCKPRSGQAAAGFEKILLGTLARRSNFKGKYARINYYGDRTPGKSEPIDLALLRKDRHLAASETRRWPPTL